jgi:AhpD family alkylhydroperoxidase
VLGECTAVDKAIFYGHGGLPRAERELAATVTSRLNGCVYCASVHSAREHVARSREVGLLDDEIADVAHAAAFFSWANRLMLSLGEPAAA